MWDMKPQANATHKMIYLKSMKNMKNSKNKNNGASVPEIFFVWSDELQERFDPFFYRPVFKKLLEVIANNKTAKITLKEAITNSYAGEWG